MGAIVYMAIIPRGKRVRLPHTGGLLVSEESPTGRERPFVIRQERHSYRASGAGPYARFSRKEDR